MPVKKCAISIQTLSRNVLLNERMRKNKVALSQRDQSVLFVLLALIQHTTFKQLVVRHRRSDYQPGKIINALTRKLDAG
ncbi:MAG: hypothetical protein VYD53_18090 [Pseudomonadota bacterium]|nr:hypothetical protein [Pseudomonadota bacterium]